MMTIKAEMRRRKIFERASKPRIYIFIKGETLLANLQNRHSRSVDLYKKQVLPVLIEQFPNHLKGNKIVWSQKAGCSCGCSPGFIVTDNQYSHYDIFVEVE